MMEKLLSDIGPVTIILVLLICIPAIVNFISWCKKIYAEREKFKKTHMEKGRALEREEETEELRFISGEARISNLETAVSTLTETIARQEKLIERLTRSDMYGIKAWIKDQHEKYTAQGWIDTEALDLVCSRHSVYKEEGGNSWADCLVNDLKNLPHRPPVVSIQPRDICDSNKN